MEFKSKMASYKSQTMKTTGGGPAEAKIPTCEDERMMDIVGETRIYGINGGLDSSEIQGINDT